MEPQRQCSRTQPTERGLEPAFFTLDVGRDKITVRLRQVDNTFDKPDDPGDETQEAKGNDCQDKHNESFLGVAEDEFMNPEGSEEDAANTGGDFLFCSGGLLWREGFNV